MNRSLNLSLLQRWLITQLVIGIVIVGAVSLVAWQMAGAAAETYFQSRVHAISEVVKRPSFPLTTSVLETISSLTQSELAIVNDRGLILANTLDQDFGDTGRKELLNKQAKAEDHRVGWIDLVQAERIHMESQKLAVLVPEKQLSISRSQAAFLPIVTGSILSIAFALAATWQFSRIVNRIQSIGKLVKRIGEGDYQANAPADQTRSDELTALSDHVKQMSCKLRESEVALRRTERDRILGQIARGLSHDFKNTIAGVRLCIQSFQRENPNVDDEPLLLATKQLHTAERLLQRVIVSPIEPDDGQRGSLGAIVSDIASMLSPMAAHHGVKLALSLSPEAERCEVEHADLLKSAIFNLALNGIQAAGASGELHFNCSVSDALVKIEVQDTGEGIDPRIENQILEPTVTTKPEGLGLGLAVVREVADLLGGTIAWRRYNGCTIFDFQFPRPKVESNAQNTRR